MHCISIYIYCISQVDSTFFRGTLTIKLLITYRFKKTKKYIRYNNNISGKGGYKVVILFTFININNNFSIFIKKPPKVSCLFLENLMNVFLRCNFSQHILFLFFLISSLLDAYKNIFGTWNSFLSMKCVIYYLLYINKDTINAYHSLEFTSIYLSKCNETYLP